MAFDESEIRIIKRTIPLILVFVLMSLVLVTIFGSWYNVHMEVSSTPNIEIARELEIKYKVLPKTFRLSILRPVVLILLSEDSFNSS
jgi:hypothetical protein